MTKYEVEYHVHLGSDTPEITNINILEKPIRGAVFLVQKPHCSDAETIVSKATVFASSEAEAEQIILDGQWAERVGGAE
jgi:hypothetical protein